MVNVTRPSPPSIFQRSSLDRSGRTMVSLFTHLRRSSRRPKPCSIPAITTLIILRSVGPKHIWIAHLCPKPRFPSQVASPHNQMRFKWLIFNGGYFPAVINSA
jgi:hypothetical protein